MKWLFIIVLLVFLAVSAGVTALLPKSYEATATVRVVPSERTENSPFAEVQASQALAKTYTELLKSPNVYEEAVRSEQLPISSASLRNSTKVSYVEGTELIEVQVETSDPSQASAFANAVAQTFIEEQDHQEGDRLLLVDPAPEPTKPKSPSWRINIALALLLGTAMAVG